MYPTISEKNEPNPEMLELGYFVHPKIQGHGVMSKALQMMITHLKKQGKVKELKADVNEHNIASQKVLITNHFHSYQTVLNPLTNQADLIFTRALN